MGSGIKYEKRWEESLFFFSFWHMLIFAICFFYMVMHGNTSDYTALLLISFHHLTGLYWHFWPCLVDFLFHYQLNRAASEMDFLRSGAAASRPANPRRPPLLPLKDACVSRLDSCLCSRADRKVFLKVSVCSGLSTLAASNWISVAWSLVSLLFLFYNVRFQLDESC